MMEKVEEVANHTFDQVDVVVERIQNPIGRPEPLLISLKLDPEHGEYWYAARMTPDEARTIAAALIKAAG